VVSQRIPFGLDRLPRTLRPDDPRLPGVAVGAAPLRLNSEALPVEIVAEAGPDHAGRVAAMRVYLRGLCGDYASRRVRFIDRYLDCMIAHLNAHRAEIAHDLMQFAGLYAPDDLLWSALRPLPRAWLPNGAGMTPVDIAFWDGTRAIVIDMGGAPLPPSIARCRIDPDSLLKDPHALLDLLGPGFRTFWRGETLPRSPFRRPVPEPPQTSSSSTYNPPANRSTA
jgi:hypothetical protein